MVKSTENPWLKPLCHHASFERPEGRCSLRKNPNRKFSHRHSGFRLPPMETGVRGLPPMLRMDGGTRRFQDSGRLAECFVEGGGEGLEAFADVLAEVDAESAAATGFEHGEVAGGLCGDDDAEAVFLSGDVEVAIGF